MLSHPCTIILSHTHTVHMCTQTHVRSHALSLSVSHTHAFGVNWIQYCCSCFCFKLKHVKQKACIMQNRLVLHWQLTVLEIDHLSKKNWYRLHMGAFPTTDFCEIWCHQFNTLKLTITLIKDKTIGNINHWRLLTKAFLSVVPSLRVWKAKKEKKEKSYKSWCVLLKHPVGI